MKQRFYICFLYRTMEYSKSSYKRKITQYLYQQNWKIKTDELLKEIQMLWWTLGCTCLFQIWFPQCVCPEVGLLLGPGALGRPREIRWRGRWEGGSGWGIHVNPWLIHVNVWQKPLQYCKVISLQLIKINGRKKKKKEKEIQMCPWWLSSKESTYNAGDTDLMSDHWEYHVPRSN